MKRRTIPLIHKDFNFRAYTTPHDEFIIYWYYPGYSIFFDEENGKHYRIPTRLVPITSTPVEPSEGEELLGRNEIHELWSIPTDSIWNYPKPALLPYQRTKKITTRRKL